MTNAVKSSSALCTPSSSTPALRRSTVFKRQNLRSTRRRRSLSPTPSSSFEAQDTGIEEHEQLVAERHMLMDELARRNEEIKKLKAVIECALTDLSNAANHLKEGSSSNEEETGRKISHV
ncbi:uncharacterized protein LOC123219530 [Mangifera indica]|uniref:uncharacterized protein LOC123219530 n=1 Tax=Mangifera indica TaxID=29780 RepID=UPI001CF982EB|nr:uncharacterized protein LOC123219530 [Mangifera indica]